MKNHTLFPGDDHSNDLMLLHLSEPADITDGVKVIDLPTEEPKVGSTCLASGWSSTKPLECKSNLGNTAGCEGEAERTWLGSAHHPLVSWSTGEFPDDLQCVNINILSNEKCIKAHTQMVTDVMLCAGELEGGKDTCNVRQPLPAER
ncbi:rCG63533 [Rattus norvegicus]|uniref:tissue kallikrein n=1 Tax=Rattus norvegicus TaxID=10116 RepID=A6JAK7_RAT|nr:rCG63533 [Rattus norvegicus]